MKLFFLDTETTGLVKQSNDFLNQPGICQIGIVILETELKKKRSWKEARVYSSFINPEIAVWEEGAIKTHGITRDKVADAPTFFEAFDTIAGLAQGCDTWCGYNTKFDRDVVWYQLLRYGFERSFPWPRQELDVMQLVSDKFGEQGKRGTKFIKQTDAYERLFKRPLANAHDALADIRACVEIFKELDQ